MFSCTFLFIHQFFSPTFFSFSFSFPDQVRESDGKVLVHCRAGMSRSATMCIAYLIKHNHWSMDKAYEFVKSRRPQIAPNFSFMVQMIEFEKIGTLEAFNTDGLRSLIFTMPHIKNMKEKTKS